MTNRATRRKDAALSTAKAKERAAVERLERMKQAALTGSSVPLSNNAAARALAMISPSARRLLLGMITVHADRGGGSCNFEDAVRALGGRTLTWRVLEELHTVGLMRFNDLGNHEMHPLFGSIAHRLYEFGHDAGHDGGSHVNADLKPTAHGKEGLLALVGSSTG